MKNYEEMVQDAINKVKEVNDAANRCYGENVDPDAILARVVEKDGLSEYEVEQLVVIYSYLAPEDIYFPISARRMKDFLENVVIKQDPKGWEKIKDLYDFKTEKPEKYLKKMRILAESFWNKFRTVENCYQYSKAFHDFSERVAPKLDAPEEMGVVERVKWLRLWAFVIKDQGFFWNDLTYDRKINPESRREFNEKVSLFPEILLFIEKQYFSPMPDKEISLELIKALIGLYPKSTQAELYKFAELEKNEIYILKAGTVRQEIKKKMFPIMWITDPTYFCTKTGLKHAEARFLKAAIKLVNKNVDIKTLPAVRKMGTDPYSLTTKKFTYYEIYTELRGEMEHTLVVASKEELHMYVQQYKWLSNHPEFRFGDQKKTVSEYGIEGLVVETLDWKKVIKDWAEKIGFARGNDLNIELLSALFKGKEKTLEQYFSKKISAEDVYKEIGFISDNQAKLCFNKKTTLLEGEAVDMAKALKRVRMFKEKNALKSDIVYLNIFRYLVANAPAKLPKNILKTYGKDKELIGVSK